jgi:hypothetical protein
LSISTPEIRKRPMIAKTTSPAPLTS